MTILSRKGLFEADITGGLMTVYRSHEPLFACRLSAQPWFVLHSDGVYAQNAHDALTPLYRGEDAPQLLTCVTGALQSREKRIKGRRRLDIGVAAVALAIAAWLMLAPSATRLHTVGFSAPAAVSSPPGTPAPPVAAYAKGRPAENGTPLSGSTPVRPTQDASPDSLPVTRPDDGWSLPAAARAGLPDRLSKAAARGLFTVPLSSGHARTLYVFADPACPNCRRMERLFDAASAEVNVVIFPVATVGGADSVKALTPVLCRPEAERATAWKKLFAADAGMAGQGQTDSTTTNEECETATAAIGVNEVAYRAYRLPGTPWIIADDGRHVPQAALSSPQKLQDFLQGGAADGTQ